MSDDLKEHINQAAQALVAVGATEVYIFGSTATGEMRVGSDVDMAVSGLPPETFFRAMGIAEDILQRPLDLIDLDEENLFTAYLRRQGNLLRVA
ncbi:MAG: nucleotidyltransferase domain-containing protein [Candidatus Hydrogenedentes bacterium]|nr:nucleotidyltransferase domain-containing protein [Candidatus Hydrogenedentota bacterium]